VAEFARTDFHNTKTESFLNYALSVGLELGF
jgi:hypothetical protein